MRSRCTCVYLRLPSQPLLTAPRPTWTNGHQPPPSLHSALTLLKSKLAYWFGWIGECEECKLAYRIDLGEFVVNTTLWPEACVPAQLAALALNSSVPPSPPATASPPFSLLGPHRNGGKRPLTASPSPHSTSPPKIGTFYSPGSRGRLFSDPSTMFCRRWVPYSMCLAHNANIPWTTGNIWEFCFSILRYSWRVKFNLKYTIPQCLSFINIRWIQLFTRIIWLYSRIADWWVCAVVFQLHCRISMSFGFHLLLNLDEDKSMISRIYIRSVTILHMIGTTSFVGFHQSWSSGY